MFDIKYTHFFDRANVTAKISEGTRKALSKIGAYVRTVAQRSLRKRKKSSDPGSPPNSHVGLIRQLMFFGYDDATTSVVVGPKLFGGSKTKGKTVPELLERGGTVLHWRTGKPASYRAFPFMAPAEKSVRDRHAEAFRNVVG